MIAKFGLLPILSLQLSLLDLGIPRSAYADPFKGQTAAMKIVNMNIVSMNIHCFDGNWTFRIQEILNKFIEVNADIISLQEVCEDPETKISQIEFIRNYLQNKNYPIKAIESQYSHQAWGRYEEFLLLISKVKVLSVNKGYLPPSLLQRAFIAFQLEPFWMVNTHLEYRADNAPDRRKQIDFLTQRFSNEPHLIGGDFNSSPTSWEQVPFSERGYQSLFPGGSHLGGDGNGSNQIDGFWLSPLLRNQLQGVRGTILLDQPVDGQYLSDHFAVFTQLSFH